MENNNLEQNNTEKQRKDLFISHESEFFVAIGYIADVSHTFIFIGVRDKRTQRILLLNAAGKYYDGSKPVACMRLKALLSEIPARLRDESFLFVDDIITSISYKAFTISENQYVSYLDEISHCNRSKGLGAYHPDGTASNDDYTKFVYEGLPLETDGVEAPINQRVKNLSISNTCRHTAKELLADTIGQRPQQGISSFWLSRLPCQTKIYRGEVVENFFIFPIPPSKSTLSPELYQVLSKIYRQMESISHTYLKNQNTVKKFAALKELFSSLDNRKEVGLLELFGMIDEWDLANQNVIDAKRGFSLFKHTATRSMLLEIKQLQPQYRR